MRFSQLRTIDLHRPGAGRRYSMLPVDHVDITGFHVAYDGSPLRPAMLDVREGDAVLWDDEGVRYRAVIDEVVIDHAVLRVAFRDAEPTDPEW
jgi:hypothetical protein